jgi:hypothetical protein
MSKISRSIFCVATLFLLTSAGVVWAECNDNFSETGATSVLRSGGQGNLACSDFIGPGGPMEEISADYSPSANPNPLYPESIDWSITAAGVSADRVIVEAADGQRCDYAYNSAREGNNLSPAGNKRVKNVVFCSDGETLPEAQPPRVPVSTAVEGCKVGDNGNPGNIVNLQDGVDQDDAIGVVVGFGNKEDGTALVAVCADQSGTTAGTAQVQCDNQCLPPSPGFGPDSAACANDLANNQNLAVGELPLSCRSCALSTEASPSPAGVANFCWELASKADRVTETFTPAVELEGGSAEVKRYEGSYCYLTTTVYYGIAYSYWVCFDY